ncbi:MAG: type I-C CRISPR-associated endonuclease Cas1c [Clostridiales bacterium]|nr:type I-C CRISPR-associated endonuclease Cas1c [Clostridiales bacterium]
MRKLLNTLYVTSPGSYLSLDGENVVIMREDGNDFRMPLHNIEGIVTFGYKGISPALLGKCASDNISMTFMTPHGRFLARVVGESKGNVLLRKEQYRISDSETRSVTIAKSILISKLFNSKSVVDRMSRDYTLRIDKSKFIGVSGALATSIDRVGKAVSLDELRGYEGEAASHYFSIFNDMILQQKNSFVFKGRNRRPPLDKVNALLSFSYSLLAKEVAAAIESVGLDAYVGFLHQDRPGRISLALDIMEEFRAIFVDRFVLSLINKKVVQEDGFEQRENGAVIMDDATRKSVLTAWQKRKQEVITHPYLEEKVEWGLVPYTQALLLARYIRGDLDGYPSFLWK